ncbi:uncharacterized protein TRAVEDRAFT_128205 [Trametes versicolor FP-101664 SS1]|uniref:uncharacterized protein n=1 Tax=Trametes versicolor (strain FP-101664) TaxID=717944 RepID=UPI00046238C7|nr:uncharacterized protein TRAVEDRAFT_128205 [Trametes versicolor FP-101664 SS1]EIW56955.1 hypothetical protein TRAVEDRAFT_128205 [Trametes versicolor FP-101664 SS1]
MVKDQDFWYEDGNLVLAAGNRLFRLYRGLLASRSPVFHAMVCSSSPKDEESFDGCPVVHLSDTSYEIQHFLRALIPLPSIIPTAAIFAIARLAHKYQADKLQCRALSCIQEYYTTRFDAWESKGLQGNVPFEKSSVPVYGIGAVNVARLTDTPSIRPLAFYDCCRLGGKVLEGVETRRRLGGALGR